MKTRLALLLAAAFTATALFAAQPSARPPLLAIGADAPDFTAYAADGRPVKLSEFRGKVVLLDFWATWCGPCKVSMPHLEKLHQKAGGADFVVLGVCVWDDRSAFDAWQVNPEVKTSYLKIFDPVAKRDRQKPREQRRDIATWLYKVSGIPTFYVIGQDGKVLHADVGAGAQTAAKLDQALKKAGVKI